MNNETNRAEGKGVMIGIGFSLLILAIIQLIGVIDGDSDDIYAQQITQALRVCEGNDGLYMIDGEMLGLHKFICNNGAVFMYNLKKDTEAVIEIVAFEHYVDLDAGLPDYCHRDYKIARTDTEMAICVEFLFRAYEAYRQ